MPKTVNILIADDHSVVRWGLKTLLERQGHFKVVAEAKNGEEAIEMAQTFHPDVAVLDIRMPGLSGIEACRQITHSVKGCKVIMLTAYAEDELLFAAIQAGAAAYVLKIGNTQELIRAVEHVSNGEGFLDSAMIKTVFEKLHNAGQAQHAAAFSVLTSKEIAILGLVTKGLTNRQIGDQLFLAEGTIRNYVSQILTKLTLTNRADAAAFAVTHQIEQLVTTS
jgi:two-component system response regulator DevR